ncbi:oligosaccharide flippase family protein [Spirosoma sp. SC4-14]|uniref:oligosaccharide flippase family protein n=1 Tax=Spirosoma sp. SC4-14 TaxID=3128900 RepID=UPI0030D56720
MSNFVYSKLSKITWISLQNNKIIDNFLSLIFIQATNILIPIIIIPYILQKVGLEKYGIVSYALSIYSYIILFVDYGFSLSATKIIAINHDNKVILSKVFSEVMVTKLLLFIASYLFLLICCITINKLQENFILYIIGGSYVLGNMLLPTWFFQGVEKMKYVSYPNAVGKILQLLLIYILIKKPDDYIYIIGIFGITTIATGMFSISLAYNKFYLDFKWPSKKNIFDQLHEGFDFFLPNLSISIVNSTTIIILGLFVSNKALGYYSIAEKIIFGIWTILGVFSQAIYPNACRLARKGFLNLKIFLFFTCFPFIILIGVSSVLIYVYAERIINLIAGAPEYSTIHLLKIMSIIPLIVSLNIPAYLILLAYNLKNIYAKIFNYTAIFNLLQGVIIIKYLGIDGAAINMISTQFFITVSLYIAVVKKSNDLNILT